MVSRPWFFKDMTVDCGIFLVFRLRRAGAAPVRPPGGYAGAAGNDSAGRDRTQQAGEKR